MPQLTAFIFSLMLLTPAAAWADGNNAAGGFIDYSGRPPYIYTGAREPLPGPVVGVATARELEGFTEVVLIGKIVAPLEYERYEFVDNTGRIVLQIPNDRWATLSVGPNDVLVVRGKVNRLVDPVEIEVIRVHTRNYYYATVPYESGAPLPMGVVSVEQALTMPNTAPLALEGNIDKKLEPGRLLFHDHSGAIVLNIDEASPLVAGPYSPGDLMIVEGRVNTSTTPTEIDVETIVDRSNFAPVIIEEAPPCAGCGRIVGEGEAILVPAEVN